MSITNQNQFAGRESWCCFKSSERLFKLAVGLHLSTSTVDTNMKILHPASSFAASSSCRRFAKGKRLAPSPNTHVATRARFRAVRPHLQDVREVNVASLKCAARLP